MRSMQIQKLEAKQMIAEAFYFKWKINKKKVKKNKKNKRPIDFVIHVDLLILGLNSDLKNMSLICISRWCLCLIHNLNKTDIVIQSLFSNNSTYDLQITLANVISFTASTGCCTFSNSYY